MLKNFIFTVERKKNILFIFVGMIHISIYYEIPFENNQCEKHKKKMKKMTQAFFIVYTNGSHISNFHTQNSLQFSFSTRKSQMDSDFYSFTHHFKIVFVKLFKSFFDREPEFNNGFITDVQSTPPLCAAIFLVLIRLNVFCTVSSMDTSQKSEWEKRRRRNDEVELSNR